MPTVRNENTDTRPLSSRCGARTIALAGCSLAAAALSCAAATPAAAAQLAATPDFVHATDAVPVPSPELLMSGATGPAVKQLQRALQIGSNGVFGPVTRQAVVRFQRSHQLQADGVVGSETRDALHLHVRIVSAQGATTASPASSSTSSTGSGGYSIPSSIVMCESGGDYSAVNSSTGAGGAYQILPSTWAAYGGTGSPQDAPPAEQNAIAAKIYASAGPGQWSC